MKKRYQMRWDKNKMREYYRKCGICGERNMQSLMRRTSDSPNGWMCSDCYVEQHPEKFFDWGLYPNF